MVYHDRWQVISHVIAIAGKELPDDKVLSAAQNKSHSRCPSGTTGNAGEPCAPLVHHIMKAAAAQSCLSPGVGFTY